jgi:hypothetical protein
MEKTRTATRSHAISAFCSLNIVPLGQSVGSTHGEENKKKKDERVFVQLSGIVRDSCSISWRLPSSEFLIRVV